MAKNDLKFEAAALSALSFTLVSGSPSEKIGLGIFVFAIFLVTDFLKCVLKKFLTPTFQIPFVLIVAATSLQIVNFKFETLNQAAIPFLVIPVFLLAFSHAKRRERVRTGLTFLLLTSIVVGAQSVLQFPFAPLPFLVIAFGIIILSGLLQFQKKGGEE